MTVASAKKSARVTLSMDQELKRQAEALFGTLGMSLSTAFTIFIRQSLREKRLPFQPSVTTDKYENKMARHETNAVLNNPKAVRFSRDEFFQWLDHV